MLRERLVAHRYQRPDVRRVHDLPLERLSETRYRLFAAAA
jgi:hypothetical protein